MSTASKKRKLGEGGGAAEKDQKFYAVRAGKVPGVYSTWRECQDNITGFKGANCELSLYSASRRENGLLTAYC